MTAELQLSQSRVGAGMYAPQCGLASTLMSWSAAEYLHMVLGRTRTCLPEAALFIIRYQSACPAHCSETQMHSYPACVHQQQQMKPVMACSCLLNTISALTSDLSSVS